MADAIGELYAARYFPPTQKARVRAIVANVATAFRAHVAHAAWLSPASRADRRWPSSTAVRRHRLSGDVGGLERPRASTRADAFGNAQRIADRTYRHALARLVQPYDPHEWALTPQTAGALLNFQQNAYLFAAALLQPPKYDPAASDAAAYGAIGAHHRPRHEPLRRRAGRRLRAGRPDAPLVDRRRRRERSRRRPSRSCGSSPPTEPLPGLARRRPPDADRERRRPRRPHRRVRGVPHVPRRESRRRGPTCVAQDREFFIAFAQAFGAKMNETGAARAARHRPCAGDVPDGHRAQPRRRGTRPSTSSPDSGCTSSRAARVRIW